LICHDDVDLEQAMLIFKWFHLPATRTLGLNNGRVKPANECDMSLAYTSLEEGNRDGYAEMAAAFRGYHAERII
jgi:hypothetical protein